MKLYYSGFQGLQLGEVFGQGLGVVYGEAAIHLQKTLGNSATCS